MNEKRLQEIQDSVDFQREMLLAQNLRTLCVDEEQELIDEIERLNNIINEFEKWLNAKYEEMYDIWYIKVLNKLKELKGSDKE